MIYLDHNATTAVWPEVADAIWPYLSESWGNPSSAYRFGARNQEIVEIARAKTAAFVGCGSDEVLFTSGATEANNTALHAALAADSAKRHIVTSVAEHSSVLATCQAAEANGVQVTYLEVDSEGSIDLGSLEAAIRPDTALVSLMWANNETGVLTPIDAVAAICTQRKVRFHCDAVQAASKLPLDFHLHEIDFLSLSGHKIGAPKGIGALIIRKETPFVPLIFGGRQEHGRRGGTESVPLIVGLGTACELANQRGASAWDPVRKMRDELEARILSFLPGAYRNGAADARLPNTLNFGIPGVDSDGLVTFLDRRDVCVSSGSACMENSLTPSHVIMAMHGDYQRANEALRISLGITTTQSDIQCFWRLLQGYVEQVLNHPATESAAPSQNLTESPSKEN